MQGGIPQSSTLINDNEMDESKANSNVGFIMKNGILCRVQLKYRKAEVAKPTKKKKKPKLQGDCAAHSSFMISQQCPEASPPLSPQEQRRRAIRQRMEAMTPVSFAKPRGSYSVDNASLRARLFQLMITRIPKLIQPVDHSVWAMQELTNVNTKCMRHAALSRPEKYPSLLIRAPVPWHQQFLIAREFATHNLFATHPVSLELRQLWDSTYRSWRLFDIAWNRNNPLDPDALLVLIRNRCHELHTSLVKRWMPECCSVLNRHKPTWTAMVPLKRGESMQQVLRFFNSLTRLISLQIRCLLYSWIHEWSDLMSAYDAGDDDDHNKADTFPKVFPLIRLELALSDGKVWVKPKQETIQHKMEKILQTIVYVSYQIPRIERIFLPGYTGGEEFLVAIAWEDDHVKAALNKVKYIVNSNKKVPERYIFDIYTKYEPMLQPPFRQSFEGSGEMTWEENEKLFMKRIEKLEAIKRKLLLLKSHVYLKLFYLDCHEINKYLVDFIDSIRSSLVKRIMNDNRQIVRKICTRFETVTEKVSQVPETTAQLVESVDYVHRSQTQSLPEMLLEVNAAGSRLLTLLNYTMLQKDDLSLSCRLFHWPSDLDSVLQVSSARLQRIRVETERSLKERTQLFLGRLAEYGEALDNFKNKETTALTTEEMISSTTLLQDLHQKLQAAQTELAEINNDETLLEWSVTHVPTLPALIQLIEPYYQLWHVAYKFHESHDVWFHGPFRKLDSQMIASEINAMYKQMQQLAVVFADVTAAKRVTDTVRKRIEKFMGYLPLLHAVCNPGLRERHWILISQNFESPMCPEPDTSLAELVSAGLMQYISRIEEVSITATKEFALEETLQRMQSEWNEICFEFLPYRDSDVSVLTGIEEIQALVDDHILRAQTMHASPYIAPLEPVLQSWEEQLVGVQDTMDVWMKVQNTWLYLEPIFSSEDIQRQMASDAAKFSHVDLMWRSLMSAATGEPRVLVAASRPGLLDELREAFAILEDIQKGLHDYLEKKRVFFSRFYFLSNDELLEILSKTKEPERIQPHLRKCFDGIGRLMFNSSQEIEAMISEGSYEKDREIVRFREPIVPARSKGMVELWMSEVDDAMKDALVHYTNVAMTQWSNQPDMEYLERYPGQSIYCASAINWTKSVTDTITAGNKWSELESSTSSLVTHFTSMIKNRPTPTVRITLNNLIMFYLNSRDIIQRMKSKYVSSLDDFYWQKNLRYYWNTDALEGLGHLTVAMVETQVPYGFEYMGNNHRLVLTPATEKGFQIMMLALKQFQGGWLHGLQGVGKTETIKELARAVAKQCLVFNCFDGLDTRSIGRILKGIVQSGAWSCFDDIDQVAPDVLSVMAVQIYTLQMALSRRMRRVNFEGSDVQVTVGSAIFITTKTKELLPDSFRSLFRLASILSPDLHYIIKISLLSQGFQNHLTIGPRIFKLMHEISEKIPDVSTTANLRSLREILKVSSILKAKEANTDEMDIIHRAFISFFQTQLTPTQGQILRHLVNQHFPIAKIECHVASDVFGQHVKEACNDLNLIPNQQFIDKIWQLHESLMARNGVILLGATLAGKSTLYKILAKIYPKITMGSANGDDGRVVMQTISPWSLPSKYLYEWSEPEKSKWNDGIITKALRELSSSSPTSPRWLVLDGHVHSELVGHLHTLLDASRKLTLPSGEILQIPQSFRLIFETSDLTYASPSTITRCGIVRVAEDIVSVDSLYLSWLKRSNLPSNLHPLLDKFVQKILKPCLVFTVESSASYCIIPTTQPYLFVSFTRLVNSLLASHENLQLKTLIFLKLLSFSTIWTVGATFKHDCKSHFHQYLTDLFSAIEDAESFGTDTILPPSESSVFSYKLDVLNGNWILWKDALPSIPKSFNGPRIIVSNESVAIQHFFIKTYSNGNVPVLILGPASVGKSQVTQFVVEDLPKDRFVHNIVHVTPVTTSSSLLTSVMIGLDRRRKGVYGPALGRRCVLFVDDLITSDPVEGNIRTSSELLRHWLNYECVFDGKTASKMELVDIHLITSVRLSDRFSEEFDVRLHRHMNTIFIDPFTTDSLVTMTSAIMERHFSSTGFNNAVSKLAKAVSVATVDLYQVWEEKAQQNVAHYCVSVSCVNRVIQGMMNISAANLSNVNKLHRLWIHETCRVWADRLMSDADRQWFISHLDRIGLVHFKQNLSKYLFASAMGGADYTILPKIHFSKLPSLKSTEIVCDEVTDMDAIIQLMEARLEQHNKESTVSAPIKLVISLNVAYHILHISHALSRPRGHVILIGDAGRGRRSCATVAALLLDYNIFQIRAGRNYGVQEWKEDVKKLIHRSGIQHEKIVFLCNSADFQKRIFFDYIGRLICGYEISELFTNEERQEMTELYQKRTKEIATFNQILLQVDENLRIALCVSPRDSCYIHLPQYPTVFKFASILWFEPWPEETLEVIAKKWLDDIPGLSDKLQLNYSNYFKNVHNSMRLYSESKGMAPHSSAAYLELLSNFRTLWLSKEKDLLQQKDRYNVGLGKLQFAASQVVVMQEELRSLQPQLVDTSAETESLMVKIEQDTVKVEAQKEIIAADESLANEAAAAAQAIKDECESDLAEATPALDAAINALDTLKPADITLVKSMRHPPSIVKLVMEAVCVMKQIPPVKKLDMSTGKITDNYWQAAQKILGDLRFLDLLRSYDKDNIPSNVMKRIREKYIPNPEFNPNIVRHVSTACEGLCRWVRAMEVYDRVIKIVAPKRAKLQEAEQELARQMKRLSEKHSQLQQISDKLQGLNDDFAAMSKKKKDLEDSIDQCHQKMERAEKLIGGLGGEQENWKTSSNNLDFRLKQLPGDVLLSASIITYLGAMKNEQRTDCLHKWLQLIQECKIPHSNNFSLVDCLIDPVKIRAWNLAGLPSDRYSLDNGIITTHCQRWPLLFDPQDQGLKWIVNTETKNQVKQIRYDDVNYLREVKTAISEGHVVVLVNVKDKLDPELDNLLEKRTFTSNEKTVIQIGSELIQWSPKFRLYLITKEENSASNLELASKLTIINFRLSRAGLEDKFLSLFLSNERPELEEQKQMLMVQSASNQRQIRDLEDRILYVLSSSRGNILEDETATKTLYSSKITSEGISVKQKEIQKSEQEIDQVRESYRAVASHAASLYSCIGQLRHLNKVYQFSLPWFINLFTNSTVSSQTSLLISERIVYVNEHFSRTLHHSICRALFNTDRQLFTVLLAFAALRSKGNVQQETIDRLYAETPLPPSHWIGPSWIDGKTWQHIMELSQTIEKLKELPQHMECSAQEWQEFCLPSNLAGNLPSPWNQLEPLEQLLIIKHLKPDCFAASVNTFIKAILGPNYSENIINDLQGAYEESKSTVPVLCFVAGNIDPCQSISSLCEKKLDNRNRIKSFTLGRGSDRTVYNLVRRCADEGNWAVIQNIHLYPDLVDEIVDQLRLEQKDFGSEFRLWLIGYASSQYSPMALQFCVKTVCESPSCFRDGLLEILRLDFVHDFSSARASSAESSFQSANPSQLEKENVIFRSEPWRRISLALFCFHALLLERTRYSTLGFAGLVEFTYYDLKSALILVKDSMLSARDISLASIRSLVVDCVYRAQLTVENDVAILRRFIDHLLSSNILQADRLIVSLCGKLSIPFTNNARILMESIQSLPKDLQPEAVGLSRDLVKQCHTEESVDLLRKLNCCSATSDR